MQENNYDFLSGDELPGVTRSKKPIEDSEFRLVPRGDGPFREKYRPLKINEIAPTCSKDQINDIIRRPHASQVYLLEGKTGTGKTSCARILAKTYVCLDREDEVKPCLICDACASFDKSYDVTNLNAANQNKIEDIRSLVEDFRYKPAVYPYKIFILDEVQRLTDAAQQVLLTELEEPPSYLLIFMCTTDSKQLSKPLADRATRITFGDLKPKHAGSIIKQVAAYENISISDEDVDSLYQQSRGSVRALLNNIQSYAAGGFDPERWEGDEAPADVVALFKGITKGSWSELAKLLQKPNIRSEPEMLRMGLESYLRGSILRNPNIEEAIKLGEAMIRLSGSMLMDTSAGQYNQFVLKCLRACYVFRAN
jgi:DNA polymerase III subunit gamma/tau